MWKKSPSPDRNILPEAEYVYTVSRRDNASSWEMSGYSRDFLYRQVLTLAASSNGFAVRISSYGM